MKQLFKSVITNDYFGVATLWFTSILIDTNTGNRMVVNILIVISLLALMRVLLKDLLGIETPYLKPLFKFIKFNRVLEKVNDTDKLYEDMDKDYHRAKNYIIKKGLVFKMKKIGKWLLANKITLSGFMATALLGAEVAFEVSSKLKWDVEWYYTAIALVFILAEFAVFGRGAETVDKFVNIKAEKQKAKDTIKAQKELDKDLKAIAESERIEKLKQELRMKTDQPQSPQNNITGGHR